jgi:hypothetical protein
MTKIFVFQPILNCFTIFESLEKYIFKKLIDYLFYRLIDLVQLVSPNLKIQLFCCSILIVQTMICKVFKLELLVDQPQIIPKVDLC